MMTRRSLIRTGILATAAFTTNHFQEVFGDSITNQPAASQLPFSLPPLPYSYQALEPHIDAQTMQIHHDKHHGGYVANLNKALMDQPELAKKSIEDLLQELDSLPETVRQAVRNHGGGHANHSLFWLIMSKDGGGEPKDALGKEIENVFGSFSDFKEKFTKTAIGIFGSGWAWLSLSSENKLMIETTPNQDSPFSKGNSPLFGVDVWEHAYYLKYQNRRQDYINAWFEVINWDFLNARYKEFNA